MRHRRCGKLMQGWEGKPDSYEADPDHRFERELVSLLDGFEVQLASRAKKQGGKENELNDSRRRHFGATR